MTESKAMSEKENYLRTIEMREPDWIPCRIVFPAATWHKYREKLEELVLHHPLIFPDSKKGTIDCDDFGLQRKGKPVLDEWGCMWNFIVDGLDGQVVGHPLENWKVFDTFKVPDPEANKDGLYCSYPSNWREIRTHLEKARKEGQITFGSVPHGFMFQRLYYLRGFKNLMMDFATENPRLQDLTNMVLDYNMKMIEKWLEIGVDVMVFGDDLGMQDRSFVSPKAFLKYLYPAYREVFDLVHRYGTYAYLHSDGHILEIAEHLITAGVDIINPQVRANGIEGIKNAFKGKKCVDLDVDRQFVLPFGSKQEIRDHIKEVVLQLGSKQGGLWILAGCYPDVPLANIEALCQAMEDYGCYYSDCSGAKQGYR